MSGYGKRSTACVQVYRKIIEQHLVVGLRVSRSQALPAKDLTCCFFLPGRTLGELVGEGSGGFGPEMLCINLSEKS